MSIEIAPAGSLPAESGNDEPDVFEVFEDSIIYTLRLVNLQRISNILSSKKWKYDSWGKS